MSEKIRLVAFDLDGTLIDTMGSFADIAGELICHHYGWSFERGRQRYLETSGVPFFQQLELLFAGDRRNQSVAALFEKQKIASFMGESLSEKACETLHRLKDSEKITAISSNNFHSLVKEFVRRENVPVDLALGYRDGFAKGESHFTYLCRFFGLSVDELLFVGDSLKDAELAAQNDVHFIAKIGTFSADDFVKQKSQLFVGAVYEIHEIPELLESL